MKKLYIFDLEGTTGIYNEGKMMHYNNTMQIRPGFKETITYLSDNNINSAIATRAPRLYTNQILINFQKQGIEWNAKSYAKEDIELNNQELINYKELSQIYKNHDIKNPGQETVILGDFLRFNMNDHFSMNDYLNFNFEEKPDVLFNNYSLNDHPFPFMDNIETPIYVVLPQPWTTIDENYKRKSLDLQFVINYLEKLYEIGNKNFSKGFDILKEQHKNYLNNNNNNNNSQVQFVENSGLAEKMLGKKHLQKYLIFKGKKENWKELEVLF